MQAMPSLLTRPGVFHTMFSTGEHDLVQEAWFEETCAAVEAYVEDRRPPPTLRPNISLGIHIAADHLFARYREHAAWEKLDPAAFADELGDQVQSPELCHGLLVVLSAFYGFLAESARVGGIEGTGISAGLLQHAGNPAKASNSPVAWRADRRIPVNPLRRLKLRSA